MKKVKLIAVDFDNTLAFLGPSHFVSLNQALSEIDPKYVISHEEQISKFEGLSTRAKLTILIKERDFPTSEVERVFSLKQLLTAKSIEDTINYDPLLVSTFSKLKQEGFLLFVASNAIRSTIDAGLKKLGISHLFDKIISNEDVKHTKPHPEIYLHAMIAAGVDPSETLIVEDSKAGREAAVRSGAHVCDVDSPHDTHYEHIKKAIRGAEAGNKDIKWSAKQTCNVLILASGSGSRMRAKHQLPKPLINVNGKSMIQLVVDNLNIDATFTFVVQKEHCNNYNLESYLKLISPNCNIVQVDSLTEGAACSALLAKEYINDSKHLLIANSDQYVIWDSAHFMYSMVSRNTDGQILTFTETSRDPKWSYVALNNEGYVTELAEKKAISDKATVGIYAFSKGSEFIQAAEQMIDKNIRTNNEFYLAPVYNEMIQNGKKISTFDCQKMYGIGTIEDLDLFLKHTNEK